MKLRTLYPALLLFCALLCTPVFAQENELKAAAKAYFEVLQSEGMGSLAQFIHPDALAEFKEMILPVYEAEAAAGQGQLRALTFGGSATIEDVRNQDPESFMNGFMKIVAAQTEDVEMSFDKLEVIGVVPEGDVRHVLTRMTVGAAEITMTELEVLSFVPFEDGWKLQLNGELRGMAAALTSQLGGANEGENR